MKTIEIPLHEYKQLLKDSAKLALVEESGFDIWALQFQGLRLDINNMRFNNGETLQDFYNKIDEEYPE